MKISIVTLFIAALVFATTACAQNEAADDGTPSSETPPTQSFGHAPDYTWLVGQIRVTAIQGGCTYLIYDPQGTDEYGGVVALPSKLPGVQNEQWVLAKGYIDTSGSQVCPGAQYSYVLTSIELQK